MTTAELISFDAAQFLDSDEALAVFMDEAFKTNDATYIAHAIGVAARAKSMSRVADETGLAREQLYRSFSAQGNPTLQSLIAVMKALGLSLAARPYEAHAALQPA